MKLMEIEKILKDLYESNINLNQNGISLSEKMVYRYLTKIGLSQEEQKIRIEEIFPDWIETFKNYPNIQVFNSEEWKYFCQFKNGEITPDCIKMYISLDSAHIRQGAKIIFDYLARNNISHKSKIGSEIRTDDIVIRLSNRIDAENLQSFINNSKYLQNGMQNVNPFCFESQKVGYAYDGHLSYNKCVSIVISDYINRMYELGVSIEDITAESFYQYVDAFSKDSYKIESLTKSNDDAEKNCEAVLALGLIKMSLRSNNIEDYFKYYEYAINEKKEMINNININNKEELFKEMVLTTMKKRPKGFNLEDPEKSGLDFLNNYLTGNINGITRDNNLRDRVKNNLSMSDIIKMASAHGAIGNNNVELATNYAKMIMLNEIIEASEIRFPGHGAEQIQEFINTGSLKYITGCINNARTIARTLDSREIRKLLNALKIQDIYQYIESYYIRNNTSIQR